MSIPKNVWNLPSNGGKYDKILPVILEFALVERTHCVTEEKYFSNNCHFLYSQYFVILQSHAMVKESVLLMELATVNLPFTEIIAQVNLKDRRRHI